MALLKCEIEDGPRAGFKSVGIPTVEGHVENLTIEERFLITRDQIQYLPVLLMGKDKNYDTCLVQLPLEADSGANRIWVNVTRIFTPDGEKANP
jgi:hypothetical protein